MEAKVNGRWQWTTRTFSWTTKHGEVRSIAQELSTEELQTILSELRGGGVEVLQCHTNRQARVNEKAGTERVY